MEDGREIFDDDLDDESVRQATKNREHAKGPRKRKRDSETMKKPSGSITSMFSNMANKKKIEDKAKIDDADILGDLMSELENEKGKDNKRQTPRVNKFAVKKTPTA